MFVESHIDNLSQLEQGWDGYDAPRIEQWAILDAKAFIRSIAAFLQVDPHVMPTNCGGLQLEWVVGDRELEVEFEAPSIIHYLKTNTVNGEDEEEIINSNKQWETAVNLVKWVQKG